MKNAGTELFNPIASYVNGEMLLHLQPKLNQKHQIFFAKVQVF
ncbi:hypothetical protein EV13_2404 [Prochlorococcus sp. MIT 0702]|nr:hypothetical protein EV13_2404 [Prochlorococcus sp. MIT 0702]KGG29397.1 hypothetical protein EV12_0179 [Prochlorococcus sp. MIT 0701]KGG33698.1 hypothetical protein EV14_1587 [Prochlorococcus sp. MIT 0703]